MSAPVNDDENSNHQMYAPKRLREHTRIPRAAQLRIDSPQISPAQPQGDRQQEYGSRYSEEGLENEVRQRVYEREAIPLPQPRRRGFSVLMWISGLAVAAACIAVLIVMFATSFGPLWDTANKAPASTIRGMAAASGAQQPSSAQGQPP